MYGKYFQYDGELSTSYNLIIGGIEQNNLEFGLNRDILRGDFNRFRHRLGHMGTKWNAPLSFNISFVKDICSEPSQRNLVFTEEEVNEINAWLTSPDYPTLFHMYDYDFERDSLNNMILIDSLDNSGEVTIYADGYVPTTFVLDDHHADTNTVSSDPDLIMPPIPKVQWLNGYFSLQFYQDEYPSKVTRIVKDGEELNRIETNEWISMHQNISMPDHSTDTYVENSYTILLNKTKLLNVKYDYFGLFTEITPQEVGGQVVGFNATFTTNAPFAWTSVISQNIETADSGILTFDVQNAERYRTINPIIEISIPSGSSGSDRTEIILNSQNDDLSISMQLKNGATTTIDCDKCQIYYVMNDDEQGEKIYESIDDVNWQSERISVQEKELAESNLDSTEFIHWPQLYNGKNSSQVTGNCSCTIQYREPRKVGDW